MRKQTNKRVKSAEKPVETVADGLEGMYISGAYDLQPVTEYRWRLLKSWEVYAKAGDDDLTFLEDMAIQNGKALRDTIYYDTPVAKNSL